ncbi:MAG: flagellar biosynthetic protein FliO [Pseudomonadota bacterium]
MTFRSVTTVLILTAWQGTLLAQSMEPVAPAPPSATMTFLKVLFALLITLLFIAGIAWFARRYQRFSAPTQVIKILGGVSLGQRERAVLIQVGDVQLVLGVGSGSVNTLHVMSTPVQPSPITPIESFSARLKQSLRQRDGE